MQTVVKKWFREKEFGYLDNGSGPDIMVRKADLVKCQFLKVGVTVTFECHIHEKSLIAKNVSVVYENKSNNHNNQGRNAKPFRFGVMT